MRQVDELIVKPLGDHTDRTSPSLKNTRKMSFSASHFTMVWNAL
jgi:hypothetical protein